MQDAGGGDAGSAGGGDVSTSTADTAPVIETAVETPAPEAPQDAPTEVAPVVIATQDNKKDPRSLLTKALEALRVGKRKKLDKVLALAQQKRTITNNDVQLALRVSDATATRYLNQLVKEGKLKSTGIRASTVYEPV